MIPTNDPKIMKGLRSLVIAFIVIDRIEKAIGCAYFKVEDFEDEPKVLDCELNSWSEWKLLNESTQQRIRTIVNLGSDDGKPCDAVEQLKPSSVDCRLDSWSTWSLINSTAVYRTRQVLELNSFGGVDCGALNETWSTIVGDCEPKNWTEWKTSPTDVHQYRSRQEVDLGGAQCFLYLEQKPIKIDCELSSWSEWATFNAITPSRTRQVNVANAFGGLECEALRENRPDPVDCQWGAWTEWQPAIYLNKFQGYYYQDREREVFAEHGGLDCNDSDSQRKPLTCSRNIISSVATGEEIPEWVYGDVQDILHTETATWKCASGRWWYSATNLTFLPTPSTFTCDNGTWIGDFNVKCAIVDCVPDNWSQWSLMSPGQQYRWRNMMVNYSFGGLECGATVETTSSHIKDPGDCELGSWSAWASFNATTLRRTRSVTVAAAFGGLECGATGENKPGSWYSKRQKKNCGKCSTVDESLRDYCDELVFGENLMNGNCGKQQHIFGICFIGHL